MILPFSVSLGTTDGINEGEHFVTVFCTVRSNSITPATKRAMARDKSSSDGGADGSSPKIRRLQPPQPNKMLATPTAYSLPGNKSSGSHLLDLKPRPKIDSQGEIFFVREWKRCLDIFENPADKNCRGCAHTGKKSTSSILKKYLSRFLIKGYWSVGRRGNRNQTRGE